jgi:hypothetical protein
MYCEPFQSKETSAMKKKPLDDRSVRGAGLLRDLVGMGASIGAPCLA